MKDIKLKGMKEFREINNISLEKVATSINLMNDSEVNFVVTSDYLAKIENRKQKNIDDNLLKALSNYLGITIEELIDLRVLCDTNINGNNETRIITLNLLDNGNKRISKDIEIPIDMPIETINNIIDLIRITTGNNNIHLEPDNIINHLLNIIDFLKKEPLYKDIIMEDYLLVKYIDTYFDTIGNNYINKYLKIGEDIFNYYKNKGFSEELCLHFVDILLNIFINNDIL